MKKKSIVLFITILVSCLCSSIVTAAYFTKCHHSPTIHRRDHLSVIELHDAHGEYVTYAIKSDNSTKWNWCFVIPQWYHKYDDVQFLWMNNGYDFVVLSTDFGASLYLYDPVTHTWNGSFYFDLQVNSNNVSLQYGTSGQIVGDYPVSLLPHQVYDYLYLTTISKE